MDYVQASTRNMVASSPLSPHAAIFKTFSAMQDSSSSILSPTAAEFGFSSAYVAEASDLSPHAVPFVSMSTLMAQYDLSLEPSYSVSMSPYEMTPQSGLSPQETSYIPMSPHEMTSQSGLSPQDTSFVPMSSYEMTYESGLSPHATTSTPMLTEQTTCCEAHAHMHSTLPDNYRPGMERIDSAIESCEASLISQYIDLKQHEDECARHYSAFLRWKYFERYDEPCEDLDIESVKHLANARNFRCTKCGDLSLELEQQFMSTYDKYMRLISVRD